MVIKDSVLFQAAHWLSANSDPFFNFTLEPLGYMKTLAKLTVGAEKDWYAQLAHRHLGSPVARLQV